MSSSETSEPEIEIIPLFLITSKLEELKEI
jgi:hypothetical protein